MQRHIKLIESDIEYFYIVRKIISHKNFILIKVSSKTLSSIVIFTMLFKKYWICCEYLTYCPVLILTHCYPGVWEIALGDLPYYQTAPCKANWTKCDFSAVKRLSQYPTYSGCPLTARFKGILSQSIQCLFGFGSAIYHQLIPSLDMSELGEAHPSPVHCVHAQWQSENPNSELCGWFEGFEQYLRVSN